MVTKKKIFLASSEELKNDRREFEIFIARKNDDLVERDVYFQLIVWENFLDSLSKTRLQDEYNKEIRNCDIFVMLFCTKVGKYTEEEFETAVGQFKDTKRPFVFTYFKDAAISTTSADQQDLASLWHFQDKLKALGHFTPVYKNLDALKLHFSQQLDKLADLHGSGFEVLKSNKPPCPTPLTAMTQDPRLKLDKTPTLLHTFLGLDPEPAPLVHGGPPMDRTHVFRLWADSEYENSISAVLDKSNGVPLIRIRFTNQLGSLPSDVTIRPLGIKAIAVEDDQSFLVFDIRAPRNRHGNAAHEQCNKALAIAVRIIDARGTQWCYQERDMRRSFTIKISDSWTAVSINLKNNWVLFEGDGNHCYAADRPDFSLIAAIVIEVGTVGTPRPGPGTGELEISGFRMSQTMPTLRRQY